MSNLRILSFCQWLCAIVPSFLLLQHAQALPANAEQIQAQTADPYTLIMPMRERSRTIDELLNDKLNNTLPALMRREGIDMWLLISREYNEDPVLKTMLPSTWLSARRRTILLIVDPGEGKDLQRYAVARYQHMVGRGACCFQAG